MISPLGIYYSIYHPGVSKLAQVCQCFQGVAQPGRAHRPLSEVTEETDISALRSEVSGMREELQGLRILMNNNRNKDAPTKEIVTSALSEISGMRTELQELGNFIHGKGHHPASNAAFPPVIALLQRQNRTENELERLKETVKAMQD